MHCCITHSYRESYERSKLEKNVAATNIILYAANIESPNEKASFTVRISRNGHLIFYKGHEQGFSNFFTIEITIQKDFAIQKYIRK